MKKVFLLIVVLMKYQDVFSQEINSEIINAEASIIIPIGRLSDKFEYAHSYGFWFKLGEDNGFVANIGITAIFLKNARPVKYEFKDSTYNIGSDKFGLDFGIKAIKIIPISNENKNHYLELDTTFGLHYLDYDFPSEKQDDEKEESKEPPFKNTTIIIAPEIKYIYKNVGLKFQYRFTPYNLIEGMESKFGSHSIAFGIVYKQ